MNAIAETKAALCGCSCPSQVNAVVGAYCDQVRFDYSSDLSIMDNAVIASRQGKNKVANVLCFADQQMAKVAFRGRGTWLKDSNVNGGKRGGEQ